MIVNFLLKMLSSKVVEAIVLSYLGKSVENPNTRITPQLVNGVSQALNNLDSGLQRKPTGPRKKKA